MALIKPRNLFVSFPEESTSKASPLAYKLCIDLAHDKCNGIDYDCSGDSTFVVPDGYIAFVKRGTTVCTDLILNSNIINSWSIHTSTLFQALFKKVSDDEGNSTRIIYYLFYTQNREFRLKLDELTQSRFRDRYYTSLVFLILAFILSFTTVISVSYFSAISFVISVVGLIISSFTHPKISEQCYLNKRLPYWGKLVLFMIIPIVAVFIAFIVLLVNCSLYNNDIRRSISLKKLDRNKKIRPL